ncbi:MAG: hypothetical protein MI867_28670 [Pseudomonadales bacterium]|nr:hypothetical protein [Pseudomonadales bacterium]
MTTIKYFFTLLIFTISIPAYSTSENTTRILFVGNSYISWNSLPGIFGSLAKAKGKKVVVKGYTMGGYKFENHRKSDVLLNALKSEKWDYVVLQNQSQTPGFKPYDVISKSLPNAIALSKAIRAGSPEAKIVYFVTWGRKNGDSMNCRYYPKVCDFHGHTAALREGYGIYQKATGGILADVGQSWLSVMNDSNASSTLRDLWGEDGSHPSYRGSYLAANTIYASIFNESTHGIEFYGKLKKDDASYYQRIASMKTVAIVEN